MNSFTTVELYKKKEETADQLKPSDIMMPFRNLSHSATITSLHCNKRPFFQMNRGLGDETEGDVTVYICPLWLPALFSIQDIYYTWRNRFTFVFYCLPVPETPLVN